MANGNRLKKALGRAGNVGQGAGLISQPITREQALSPRPAQPLQAIQTPPSREVALAPRPAPTIGTAAVNTAQEQNIVRDTALSPRPAVPTQQVDVRGNALSPRPAQPVQQGSLPTFGNAFQAGAGRPKFAEEVNPNLSGALDSISSVPKRFSDFKKPFSRTEVAEWS